MGQDRADRGRVRIDRWLWAARFFKTRSLAAEAVQGGHVQVNGVRAKPAKDVGAGDVVDVTIGQLPHRVTVLAVAERRGPASAARGLYEDDATVREAREARLALLRQARPPGAELGARPTKRDRRRIDRASGRGG